MYECQGNTGPGVPNGAARGFMMLHVARLWEVLIRNRVSASTGNSRSSTRPFHALDQVDYTQIIVKQEICKVKIKECTLVFFFFFNIFPNDMEWRNKHTAWYNMQISVARNSESGMPTQLPGLRSDWWRNKCWTRRKCRGSRRICLECLRSDSKRKGERAQGEEGKGTNNTKLQWVAGMFAASCCSVRPYAFGRALELPFVTSP